MGRPGLTREEVIKIIEQLTAEGSEATATSIRERLGRGSFSTISAILSEWRSERRKGSDLQVPEMPGAIQDLTRHIWQEAWKLAFGAHESEKASFGRERQEYEKVKGEMGSEIRRLEQDLEDVANKASTLREEIEKTRVRLAHAEGRAESSEKRLKELDRRNQELSDRVAAEASKLSALSERIKHLEGTRERKSQKQ